MEHKVEEVKLKCGAKGLLIDVPEAPVFCMEIWFRAGYESVKDPELRETAHIMEHLACGANKMHPSMAEVDRYVSMNGAYSNAWTNVDYLAYVRVCPDFDWERILEQLIIQVTTPKFLDKEFKAEFGNVEEEMQRSSNNRWTELDLRMRGTFGWKFSETYPERLEKMQGISVDHIMEHYKRTHNSDNALFFVAGNLSKDRSKILEYLEGLDQLPSGKKFKKQSYPSIRSFTEPVCINKPDVPNIYFAIDTYFDVDHMEDTKLGANLNVLCRVLSYGDNSRIYGKLRQRGLVYVLDAYKGIEEGGKCFFGVACEVGPKNVNRLIDLVVQELKDLKKVGLTKEEVDEAIVAMKGSRRMGNQRAIDILNWNAGWYTSDEQERVYKFEDVDEWYDGVTPESIQELFLNLIKTKKWGAGFLGNVTDSQAKKWNKKLAEIFED